MSRATSLLRDGLISLSITAILLLILNFVLVHFALGVFKQPLFPRTLLRYVDPCYLTLYHDTHGNEFRDWIAVAGDSYAAGSGDEFLDRKPDYGIFPKLRSLTQGNYFVFGRGGFGSINAAKELMLCVNIHNHSFLLPKVEAPKQVMFLFYEGNDLDNNVDHLQHEGNGVPVRQFVRNQVSHPDDLRWRELAMNFPLFDLIGGQFSRVGRLLPGGGKKEPREKSKRDDVAPGDTSRAMNGADGPARAAGAASAPVDSGAYGNHVIVGGQARAFAEDPQAAAPELAGRLDEPLQVFFESVLALKEYLPDTKITIVYLPSVVTVYRWQDPIRAQEYHTDAPVFTTNLRNRTQSDLIRRSIEDFAASNYFGFVDPTGSLQSAAAEEFVHGPRDPQHFNAAGNWIVARFIAAHAGSATPREPGRP